MDKRWNLNTLYSGFDSESLAKDMETFEVLTSELMSLIDSMDPVDKQAPQKMLEFMQKTDILTDLISNLYSYASLTYQVDTSNIEAAKMVEKIQSKLTQTTLIEAKTKLFLKQIDDLSGFISSAKGLETYAFHLQSEKEAAMHLLSTEEELLLAQLKNTGSKSWVKLQDHIVSTLTASLNGKTETLTVLRSKAYEADPALRKEAYEAELAAYKKKDQESAACLNAIKGEVITVANMRAYDSPLDMTLMTSRMHKETLEAMMQAIEEYLPYFRKYFRKKAELLGHKNGLPWYDLFAPVGEVDMRYTYSEARDYVVKHFTSFSQKLGDFAARAFDKDWIDAFPREGKVAGAFCANLHGIKESRIMSNFSGSFNDMTTLAHELGHGYHGECLNQANAINADYPMPLAETASIFCETIVFNAALKNASKEEKMVIIENELLGASQVIVDIYSRYLFESELFEKRKTASLSVEELNEAMIKAQKKAYGDGLDHEALHPYMWMCKPHYYYAESNFYNFPYAFGLLFAKGLYAIYQKDQSSFVPKYDDLLLSTGCNNIHDVLKIVGIDSHKPDFFRASLELIKESIETFLSL
jgi:pepF/M3 family oligoendopeptidase